MKKFMFLLGRICLSLIFVSSAAVKIVNWDETVHFTSSALSRWISETPMPGLLCQVLYSLSAHSALVLAIATFLEGVGGLFVLLGFRVRFGALLLIAFLIPVTLFMHPFWLMSGQERMDQMIVMMKNLSILGGLMILAAKGGDHAA